MEHLGGQGLMSCCGNLEADAERIADEGGLASEVSEGSKGSRQGFHVLF